MEYKCDICGKYGTLINYFEYNLCIECYDEANKTKNLILKGVKKDGR